MKPHLFPQPSPPVLQKLKALLSEAHLAHYQPGGKGFRPRKPGGNPPAALSGGAWRSAALEAAQLHARYTSQRGDYQGQENPIHHLLAGYQYYFLPRNLFRVWGVLAALPWRQSPTQGFHQMAGEGPLQVADLGCGSGAFSLGLLALLAMDNRPPPPLAFTLVDQGRQVLEMAQANIQAAVNGFWPGHPVTIRTARDGVEGFFRRPAPGQYQLVGAAFMLNELNLLASSRGQERAAAFSAQLARLAGPQGVIALVEPGTRRGYLNLMAMHQTHPGMVLYPCTHQQDCPLYTPKAERWCHATWPLPSQFFFDGELKSAGSIPLDMIEVNLSALVYQPGQKTATGAFAPHGGYRLLSDPMGGGPSGRGKKVLACGPGGELSELEATGLTPPTRGGWLEKPAGTQNPSRS